MKRMIQGVILAGLVFSGGCVSAYRGRTAAASFQKAVEAVSLKAGRSEVLVVLQFPEKQTRKIGGLVISRDGGKLRGRKVCTGIVLDRQGHVLVPWLIKPEEVRYAEVWIGDHEYSCRILQGNKQINMTMLQVDVPETECQPINMDKSTVLKTGEWGVITEPSDESRDYRKYAYVRISQGVIPGYYRTYAMDRVPRYSNGSLINALDGSVAGIVRGGKVLVWDDYKNDIRKLLAKSIEAEKESGAEDQKEEDDDKGKDAWLGVTVVPVNRDYADLHELPHSALVAGAVAEDSPADKAGLKSGDVIIGANGRKLELSGSRAVSFFNSLLDREVGKPFDITVLRNGRKIEIKGAFEAKPDPATMNADDLGITVRDLTGEDTIQKVLFIKKGVLVTDVRKGGPAATSSSFGHQLINKGYIITELDGVPTPNVEEFSKVVDKIRREHTGSVLIKYINGRVTGFAGLNLKIGEQDKEKDSK